METILSSLNFTLSVIIGLLLLVVLVVVHELGHAIAARRNGVEVEEFGVGFPPRAWAKKLKNGILFTLNWLPLGGFVKLKGEHDAATGKGTYGGAGLWAKTKILLAGVVMNWVTAVAIFAILALFGMPKVLPNQFSVPADTKTVRDSVVAVSVVPDQPADKAGIMAGDKILKLNDESIESADQLAALTKSNAGKTVAITYERDGRTNSVQAALNETSEQGKGFLGVAHGQREYLRATWSAPIVGAGVTVQFTYETFKGLGSLFANLGKGLASKLSPNEEVRKSGQQALDEANQGIAGPIGILGVIFPQAREAGLITLLFLTGIISLTLAVINILPIPALDGGRLFVTLIFKGLRKPLTKDLEERIHATGFMVLMGLILFITFLDVGKISGQ